MISIANFYILKKDEYERLQGEHKELITLRKAINDVSNYCSPIGPLHSAGWNGALDELKKRTSGFGEWIK